MSDLSEALIDVQIIYDYVRKWLRKVSVAYVKQKMMDGKYLRVSTFEYHSIFYDVVQSTEFIQDTHQHRRAIEKMMRSSKVRNYILLEVMRDLPEKYTVEASEGCFGTYFYIRFRRR